MRTYKNIIKIVLSVCFALCLASCTNKSPADEEIYGVWKNKEVGSFTFRKDHTFSGTNLKSGIFLFQPQNPNKLFNGMGTWKLQKEDGYWEIELYFNSYSIGDDKILYHLLIGGENGILENKRPWYLYVWKDEEGGERIIFKK